jgi:hypothetical protein
MKKFLTALDKMKMNTHLLKRDGPNCLYCEKPVPNDDCEMEHLDNNKNNLELWNIIRCHEKCNKEKRNNIEYEVKAKDKLDRNQARIYYPIEDTAERSNSPEIEHNTNCNQLVKKHLSEQTKLHGKLEYKATSDSIAYHAMEKFGHSSQVSINRIIDAYCSEVAPFMVIKENGKRYITKRVGN